MGGFLWLYHPWIFDKPADGQILFRLKELPRELVTQNCSFGEIRIRALVVPNGMPVEDKSFSRDFENDKNAITQFFDIPIFRFSITMEIHSLDCWLIHFRCAFFKLCWKLPAFRYPSLSRGVSPGWQFLYIGYWGFSSTLTRTWCETEWLFWHHPAIRFTPSWQFKIVISLNAHIENRYLGQHALDRCHYANT